MTERILVIKLGALGDFIYALGPMAAIRRAHPDAHITLMTTKPYAGLGRDCGYFDEIFIDAKPKALNILGWFKLRRTLNAAHYKRVYDLQNNDRTALYFKLFSPKPEWVGAVAGASHRNASPERSTRHAYYGHVQTLAVGGVTDVSLDPLHWMASHFDTSVLKPPYVVLVAGCSPQNPGKRWPVEHFRGLAGKLIRHGYTPVLIGTKDEADVNAQIARGLEVIDLTSKTALCDIPTLVRGAAAVIGNDTGPMHMAAVVGAPFVMMFSNTASNVILHAPPFPEGTRHAAVLAADDNIGDISFSDVFQAFLRVVADPSCVRSISV